jgi:hypothetical protein
MSISRPRLPIISIITLVLFFLAFTGCNFTPAEEEDNGDAIQTAAAQTIEANNLQLTLNAQSALLTAQAQTLQAPPEQQPEQTEAPMPQETEAPPAEQPPDEPPAEEPPPEQPPVAEPNRITADVDTNCREGPSPDFPKLTYLPVGQEWLVIGQNPDHTWWLVQNPNRPDQPCWVWGETTHLLGDPGTVEIVEPPPPPVVEAPPDFDAAFSNIHPCGGVATIFIWVGVSSPHTFRSSTITIRNLDANQTISGPETSNAPFVANDASCPPGMPELGMGGAAYVSKGMGSVPPPGTRGRAIIVLCTEPSQGGLCVEKKVNFNFP